MISTPKIVGLMACGFMLCAGLSSAAQAGDAATAAEDMKAGNGGQAGTKGDQKKQKGQDGKEVRLLTDQPGQKSGNIKEDDRMKAEVNDQKHAPPMGSAETTDRRNDKSDSMGGSK